MVFRIVHYKTLDSTNHLAKILAEKGASEGTVIFTDFQTQGRGQFERTWQSPRGKDLLFSIILRPEHVNVNALPMITQLAAEAIRDYLKSEFLLNAKIKKPNDVLVDGKKICGILTECSTSAGKADYVILGIGLNVNSTKKELLETATSIRQLTGTLSDRKLVLRSLLSQWEENYENNRVFARH